MYDNAEFQTINAAIWSTTAMLLDDCEQVVAQLRGIREILENELESQGSGHVETDRKRKRKSEVATLPPLPEATAKRHLHPYRYPYTDSMQAVKRVRVLSPEEANKFNRSTPLGQRKQDRAELFEDPFQSPAARCRPAVIISSESD